MQRCRIRRHIRRELYVPHEFAGALQDSGRIRQRRALKESNIHVCREHVDVGKRRIAQAGGGHTIMHDLADIIAALAHHFKPLAGNVAEFPALLLEPCFDGGVSLESAAQSEEFCSDHA